MEHLVSLMGLSTLANAIAVESCVPRRVSFVGTSESAEAAARLVSVLDRLRPGTKTSFVEIKDPESVRSIRTTLQRLPAGWSLDYTQGPPVMVAQARLCFVTMGAGNDGAAFHVDDRAERISFDDGTSLLVESKITLGDIVALHGRTLGSERAPVVRPRSRELMHVARHMTSVVAREGSGARALDRVLGHRRDAQEWARWRDGGRWLELAVADAASPVVDEMLWSADLLLGNGVRRAELDVIVRRGQRVGVISCFASSGSRALSEAKKHLFEVLERARQVGGPGARAALVTLLPEPQVGKLLADIETEWGRPDNVAVWGRAELVDLFDGDPTIIDAWMN